MPRSIVTQEPIKLPTELKTFFDNPPLVGTELRDDFENFLLTIATPVRPVDAIEWLLVYDVVCLSWEIRRERLVKAGIIELKRIEFINNPAARAVAKMTTKNLYKAKGGDSSLFGKKDPIPEAEALDPMYWMVRSFRSEGDDIDAVDRRIASYEHRRNAALSELDRYSESRARKLKATLDIVDGEFTEAAE